MEIKTPIIPENVLPTDTRSVVILDSAGKKIGMILPGVFAPPSGKPDYSFAVWSDLHIIDREDGDVLESIVTDAISEVNNSDCAFIAVTGDLTQEGTTGQQARYKRIMANSDVPVYAISGNHDTIPGYPTDEFMINYAGKPLYYAVAKTDAIPTEPPKMYATAPVKHGIINDQLWINGVMQTAYKLVEFEGAFYFISDGNKIARSTNITLSAANIGDLTYPDGTAIVPGKYYFNADGKMTIKNGIYNWQLYINNVLQRCYHLYKYDGEYYFVSDENLVVHGTTSYMSADVIGGLTYPDGTAIPVGNHRFDEFGRLMRQNGIINDRLYINYVVQTANNLVAYGGNFYFIGDGDKIVRDTTVILTDEQIGGLTYADGTPIPAGDHYFDADGHMDLTPPVQTVTRVYANEAVSEGDLLIFLGHYGKDHTLNGGWLGGEPFSAEELSWLNKLLAANVGKRVMIFIHPYIPGGAGDIDLTVTPPKKPPNLWTPSDGITTDTGADFLAILSRYPGAVVFNGHSHYRYRTQEVKTDAIIHHPADDSYISVHVPSLTRLRDVIDGKRVDLKSGDEDFGGEGYIVDVYPDCIYLRGRDFVRNNWVGLGTYVINTTGGQT